MKAGLVSVVVPVYNTEKYLDRCIQSIVNQTYCNLEILLIDDESPDACPQMCDDWAALDNRISVIHKKNEGSGKARNTGIEHSTGEYVCFIDSDDYIALDTIEKAYNRIQKTGAEIATFGMIFLNSDGQVVKRKIPKAKQDFFQGDSIQSVVLPDMVDGEYTQAQITDLSLSACVCMFSMALIQKMNWRFASVSEVLSEDSYSLIMLYSQVKRVVILPEALYYYCENETSQSRSYDEARFEKIKHLYRVCIALADQYGYCREVHCSISALILAQTIGTMKQIVKADLKINQQLSLFKQIVTDPLMHLCLKELTGRRYSWARTMLFWAMKHNLVFISFLFVFLQVKKQK